MTEHYIECEDVTRLDADGDDTGMIISIFYSAEDWIPFTPATRVDPAEGGYFENIIYLRCEISEHSGDKAPLTPDEIAAAEAWFDRTDVQERAMETAIHETENDSPDPDESYERADNAGWKLAT